MTHMTLTFKVDINGASSVTPVSGDEILIADASDSNNIKITVGSLPFADIGLVIEIG